MNDPHVMPAGGDENLLQDLNAPKAWVGESVGQAPRPERDGKKPFPFAGKVGIVGGLMLMIGGIGFAALTGDADEANEAAPIAAEAPDSLPLDGEGDNGTESVAGEEVSRSGDQGAPGDSDEPGSNVDDAESEVIEPVITDPDSPPSPPGAEGNYSILANGKIYLRGTVPSVEIREGIVAAVTLVMGEGNVVPEYAIDPSEPFEMGRDTPVYVADTVLFGKNSAEIAPDFLPLIGLGVTLMQIQPSVTIEIIGHTDSVGSDELNLALSQDRVDAVKSVFLSQGIDASRLIATGLGESTPVATNETEAGRQANRRVEFIIKGFMF